MGDLATDGDVPCALRAFGVARVPYDEINGLRKTLGPSSGRKIAPSLMKHADHQTVLALSAVLKAIDDFGWRDRAFEEWGLIAAPRFLGRFLMTLAADRYAQVGPSGVSPLLSPTISMHAVAGTISVALKTHGFNFGAGGGHGHLADALLTGLAMRDECGVPGVWIVATELSPEPRLDFSGKLLNAGVVGKAVALAVTPTGAENSRWNLRLVPTATVPMSDPDESESEPDSGMTALAEFLNAAPTPTGRPRRWYCPIPGCGAIELDDDPTRALGAIGDGPRSFRAG